MTDVGSRSQNIEMARVSTEVTEPYRAALNGDWEAMKSFYENNPEAAVLPLTVTNDTPLHIAVYSGTKSPLEELLRIVPDGFSKPNDLENTPLHEAGVIGNVEAARVLVRCSASVGLGVRNALGETPLFRAAAFGMTEMVKYLAAEVGRVQGHDMEVQRVRYDGISILHIAIIGQHFETALWLLGNDDMLGEAKDESGRTCLHLLADMPSAFKSGSAHEGRLKELIYFCLPADENDEETRVNLNQKDLESGWGEKDHNHKCSRCSIIIPTGVRRMYSIFRECLAKGWPLINEIWKEKRKHQLAWKLAKLLILRDKSWKQTHTKLDVGAISFGGKRGDQTEVLEKQKEIINSFKEEKLDDQTANKGSIMQPQSREEKKPAPSPMTPLLLATSRGILEIVEGILQVHPQAVEHVSNKGHNIMHVAIRHRQKEIFCRVKKMRIPMARLSRKIDDDGNTLLHHVADMTDYGGGSQPNPALQLQEELQWFESVKKLIPSHYDMHHNRNNEAAQEFFERTHSKLLEEAQNWLKRTSESCSVIAVLIATVAFTAAYTVPGGSNDKTGLPILLHDPFFLVFTVMDVLSLVSSLTSVVMFISILTSPFRFQDFHHSLPKKLTLAFTFLFFSVAVTMLAFSATVLLIIHMKKRWTTTLLYAVAFVPVTVFALLQFPLYFAFMGTLRYSLSMMKKVLPSSIVRSLFRSDHTTSFWRNE